MQATVRQCDQQLPLSGDNRGATSERVNMTARASAGLRHECVELKHRASELDSLHANADSSAATPGNSPKSASDGITGAMCQRGLAARVLGRFQPMSTLYAGVREGSLHNREARSVGCGN